MLHRVRPRRQCLEFSNTEVFHLNFRIEKFDFRPPKQRQEANKKVQFGYFFRFLESRNISVKIQFKQTCGEKPWLDDSLGN